MIALKNILVATDFSEPSDAALLYGRALARNFNATLHVVHVVGTMLQRRLRRGRVRRLDPGTPAGGRRFSAQAARRAAHRQR